MENPNIEVIYNQTYSTQVEVYNLPNSSLMVQKYRYITKRVIDIVISLLGIVFSFPILLISSILIKIDSKGPILYTQKRVGLEGKIFTIYKLRSMRTDAEANGPKWADVNDERVTKVGKVLRQYRIDELPQFINIIKGEMSVVGPRPERPEFTFLFENQISGFLERLKVKPGLTGLAQVNGGYELTPSQKLEFDIEYIEKMSIALDIKIITRTALIILFRDGAR